MLTTITVLKMVERKRKNIRSRCCSENSGVKNRQELREEGKTQGLRKHSRLGPLDDCPISPETLPGERLTGDAFAPCPRNTF